MKEDQIGAQVDLKTLKKSYDNVVAVNNVSLNIKTGEFLTLLGPSGSGKTSILMMIAGFIRPTSGEVLINREAIVADHSSFN